jgi:hypothetical protein
VIPWRNYQLISSRVRALPELRQVVAFCNYRWDRSENMITCII